MLRVGLILSSPSPHQVELLNAIARHPGIKSFAAYVNTHNPARNWGRPTPDMPWQDLPTGWIQMLRGDLARWVEGQHADVWLLSSVYTDPATHILARTLERRGQPFAFLGEPPQPRSGLRHLVRHSLMMSVVKRADAVIGTGIESARRYQRLSRPDQKIGSVPYYVDVSSQLAVPPIAPPADDSPYRFVASSQLIHRKGLDVLIEACRLLPPTGWTLDIFGDGPLRSELEQHARSTGRPITFQGLLPYEEKDRVFENRHCFVFSTRWDGWGMVLPEALAMGLPVISTDQAMSAHEFIRDGVNGRIGPAEDVEYLANAMRQAMESRSTLREQSIAAKESLAEYTPEIGAARLVELLQETAARAA